MKIWLNVSVPIRGLFNLTELDFYDLLEECWSGAISTLETIESNNKEEEFMDLLSVMDMNTLTEINDFLWFDDTYIYDCLGIDTEEDE